MIAYLIFGAIVALIFKLINFKTKYDYNWKSFLIHLVFWPIVAPSLLFLIFKTANTLGNKVELKYGFFLVVIWLFITGMLINLINSLLVGQHYIWTGVVACFGALLQVVYFVPIVEFYKTTKNG